jgi:uncharacterized protein YecE (DUF72 family)
MDRRASAIHIGTRGWQFPDDASGFYPEDLPEDWRLEYYTTQLHALELPPLTAPPAAETVAEWEEQTLEDAALSLPLEGDWARRLASGGDLTELARSLAPLGDKLAVMLWPQKPPTGADRFWPGTFHLDTSRDPILSADPAADGDPPGPVYRRLDGPGRYPPDTLQTLANHLRNRAARGRETFVFFTETRRSAALLDAMTLNEAADSGET